MEWGLVICGKREMIQTNLAPYFEQKWILVYVPRKQIWLLSSNKNGFYSNPPQPSALKGRKILFGEIRDLTFDNLAVRICPHLLHFVKMCNFHKIYVHVILNTLRLNIAILHLNFICKECKETNLTTFFSNMPPTVVSPRKPKEWAETCNLC